VVHLHVEEGVEPEGENWVAYESARYANAATYFVRPPLLYHLNGLWTDLMIGSLCGQFNKNFPVP
jgi:hypothetical protein